MLNNINGEISISWNDKSLTRPLSSAIVIASVATLSVVMFTAIIGFIFLGLSLAGVLVLLLLTIGGLIGSLYFGREYLLEKIFSENSENNSQKSEVKQESSQTTVTDSTLKETKTV
tara:strand:- start:43978 stop:44325 length:348 start_codon:yes stop_codon:yes gene_type:complete